MSRRVLFLDHSGALGGAELYLLDVLHHFRECSETVVFQKGPFPDRLHRERLNHVVMETGSSFLGVQRKSTVSSVVKSAPAIIELVAKLVFKARAFDIIYANSQKALIVGGLVSLISGRPLIWNLHDILTADHFSSTNRKAAILWSNLFAAHVVVNSKTTLSAYRSCGGKAPTSVVYNGLRPDVFDEISRGEIAKIKRDVSVSDAPLVGVFSRLASWKGQHVLLEALSDCPEWEAVIVGDALFQEDEKYAARLRQMVSASDLQNRVHFLGFREDVPAVMKAVDVVAHTSTSPEPFGRVVVEGMLAGKPVIATAEGGPSEILDDGNTGFLIPAGDAGALAQQLKHIDKAPRKMRDVAQRGRQHAREYFSVERMLARLEQVIHKISR